MGAALIPSVGLDYTYLFIIVLVLGAWFSIKWGEVKSQKIKGSSIELILGVGTVVAIYGYNIARGHRFGILDFSICFAALALAFYGIRSFKLFWVPAIYGVVLLLGYQLESLTPNYTVLQDWMAGVMASGMAAIGVPNTVVGHTVFLDSAAAGRLALEVQSDCTGIQGILAFGLLSTMSVLGMKPKMSRLIPIFAIGFVGAFLINIVRLYMVFLTFTFLGVDAGTSVHVYAGYTLFIVWVLVFWSVAFRFLSPPASKTSDVFSTKPLGMPERPPA